MEASQVKRQWDKRKEIELLRVANFDVSFKLLASLPKKKTQKKKKYLFWPAWSTAPFALGERETLHPQLQKNPKPQRYLVKSFLTQFLSFSVTAGRVRSPLGSSEDIFCKWQNTC